MTWRDFQRLQKVRELGQEFISYVDAGRSNEALVFLHGIPTWGYVWRDFLGFSKSRRVLIPDLLGFGYSDKADQFDRSIARQTNAIVEWMDAIGVQSATFVAHDIGGGIAQRLATLHPERVDRLCLINSVCYDSWPIEAMLQLGHPLVNKKVSAGTLQKALRVALSQGFASTPKGDMIEGLLAPYSTEVGKLSLIRDASALNTNLTTEIVPLLHKIQAPTLVIWGAQDPFQPAHYAERLVSDIPGATLARIDQARHFAMVDQPQAVAREISRFIVANPLASRKRTAATRARGGAGAKIRPSAARSPRPQTAQ